MRLDSVFQNARGERCLRELGGPRCGTFTVTMLQSAALAQTPNA